MNKKQQIWIYGTGAIGSSLGALLFQAGCSVKLIGTSPHWSAIRADGLQLHTPNQDPIKIKLLTISPEDLPRLGDNDLVLLTGKLTDLPGSIEILKHRLSPDTDLITLQNGLFIDQQISDSLARPVDRGLIFFGANSPRPGEVFLYPGRIKFKQTPVTQQLASLFTDNLISAGTYPGFTEIEWTKLAINCIANPLAGLLGVYNLELSESELDPVKELILAEIRAVALANGVKLSLSTGDFNRYMQGATGGNIASLYSDLKQGKETEIEALNGFVVEEGARLGIPTPANALLTSLIRFLESAAKKSSNTR